MIIIQIKSYTVMKDGTVANYRKNHLVKWEQYLQQLEIKYDGIPDG